MANSTAVYLSNEAIQMVSGSVSGKSISIRDFNKVPLPAGAMLNGVITNEYTTKNVLEQIKRQGVNAARLVIDSGLVLMRNAVVPTLSPKQLMKFTQDELSNLEGNYENVLYDYAVISTSREDGEPGGSILCCGMERKLIDSYVELFQAVGIKVQSIDISVNCVNKLTSRMPELQEKTYILSFLDGNYLLSLLYEKNSYTFSNRSRLFAERGTPAFDGELAGKISSLIQFSKAQKSKYSIETAYFCGLQESEHSVYEEISMTLGVEAKEFPDTERLAVQGDRTFHLAEYPFPVGCLIRK